MAKRKAYTAREKELEIISKRESFLKRRISNMGEQPLVAITFVNSDGVKTVQKIQERFLVEDNGKPKNQNKLVADISALASDFKAKYIIL